MYVLYPTSWLFGPHSTGIHPMHEEYGVVSDCGDVCKKNTRTEKP
jgi:hypothetical protein